ncbi:hypothetical protein V8C40DRAFT_213302 [Trichoderma camerunense]
MEGTRCYHFCSRSPPFSRDTSTIRPKVNLPCGTKALKHWRTQNPGKLENGYTRPQKNHSGTDPLIGLWEKKVMAHEFGEFLRRIRRPSHLLSFSSSSCFAPLEKQRRSASRSLAACSLMTSRPWPEIAKRLAGDWSGGRETSGESSQSSARLRRMASCANHFTGITAGFFAITSPVGRHELPPRVTPKRRRPTGVARKSFECA